MSSQTQNGGSTTISTRMKRRRVHIGKALNILEQRASRVNHPTKAVEVRILRPSTPEILYLLSKAQLSVFSLTKSAAALVSSKTVRTSALHYKTKSCARLNCIHSCSFNRILLNFRFSIQTSFRMK